MIRTLLLSLALSVASLASAQTYFYIDQIVVNPANPTTADAVTIDVMGNLSSSGAYIAGASAQVTGSVVTLYIMAMDPGGLAVLVPHTETISVGQLAPGTYTIVVNGVNVADFAPVEDHSFTVTVGISPCDGLSIPSIQWNAFDPSSIVMHVFNTSTELFDYPNFILYDADGDTLAKEPVDAFGLAVESWRTLPLHPDATPPTAPFTGTLQLWTDFGDSLNCTWQPTVELCPPTPCSTLIPFLQNFGGGLVIGSFSWNVMDNGGNSMATGQFTMTNDVQYESDTICVPPGNYTMAVAANQPPSGGNPVFSVSTDGFVSGPSQQVVWDLPVIMPFTFYERCIEGTNGVAEIAATSGITATPQGDGLLVRTRNGSSLGAITLHDAQGKLIHQGTVPADNMVIRIGDANGLFVLRTQQGVLKVGLVR